MKKKIVIFMMLAALVAVPVFAATSDQNQAQSDRFSQMTQNHQKMMQQAVDNGTITADEAAQVNDHMQQIAPIMQKVMKNGGMMNGMGNGMMQNGGAGGNCNNNNNNNK